MSSRRTRAEGRVPRVPASFDEADQELARALDNLSLAVNYADWLVDLAAPHLGPHILEVGAGHGTLTGRLARLGLGLGKVTATELSARCAATLSEKFAGRPDVEVLHGDIDDGLDGRRYDSAVLVNVLEHIADDAAALNTLYRGLRPGGTVVLFVPAFDELYSEFDKAVGHHRRYRRDDLAHRVRQAGFDVVNARYVNFVGGIAWWLVVRQLGRFPTGRRSLTLYDRWVVPAVRRLETRWVPPFGQSVLCIGRRPVTAEDA